MDKLHPETIQILNRLDNYHYRLISWFGHDLGHLTVRAYLPNNPGYYYDILFAGTGFIRLSTYWKNHLLAVGGDADKEMLLSELGNDSYSRSGVLYSFGSPEQNLNLLAFGEHMEKPPHNTNDAWYKEINFHEQEIAAKPKASIIALSLLPKEPFYSYSRGWYDYKEFRFMVVVNTMEPWGLIFNNVQYMQVPAGWIGPSFQLANNKEKGVFLAKNNLEHFGNLLLLKNRVIKDHRHKIPIYILCSEVEIIEFSETE